MHICLYSHQESHVGGGQISTATTAKYLKKYHHTVILCSNIPSLRVHLKSAKPDILLHHNIKDMVAVQRLAEKHHIPFIPTINGLFTCGKGTHIRYSYFGEPNLRCSLTCMIRCSIQGHYRMPFPRQQQLKYLLSAPYRYARMRARIAALNKSAAVIAVGKTLKEILQLNGVTAPIVVVPQPVDEDILNKPNVKKQENKLRILFTNGFDTTKGILPLLDAFSRLNRNDAELLITGRIYPIIKSITVPKDVTVLGEVPFERLKELYYTSDILAYPTLLFEPFGRAWAEAACVGLPIIAFKGRAGPADYLEHGKTAYLADLNVAALQEGIETLLDNAALRKKLSRNVREFARKHFLAPVVADKLINVYASTRADS
ncbi:glycosyltransferase family 4 protein [Candidatus Woesearchaeota archaeon]|nr:glycosyltransferase family 4 protein [Candidatus Woesearchaeota archaeon]